MNLAKPIARRKTPALGALTTKEPTQTELSSAFQRPFPSTVVLATDFSSGARRALRRTQYVPFDQDAEVIVVHVLPPRESIDHLSSVEATSMLQLDHEVEILRTGLNRRGRMDVRLKPVLVLGNPHDELTKIARESSADLLVVGRRGTGTIKKLLLGSTAERVVHAGPTSVLIATSQPAEPYQHPLVGLPADETLGFVMDAAFLVVSSDIQSIDVVTAVTVPLEGWLWSGWVSTKEILRVEAVAQDRSLVGLDRLLAPYRQAGLRCRVIRQKSDPRHLILTVAAKRKPDLIVVGTHARTGIVRFHLGSVAAHIIRHASCDVLVARSRHE